MDYFLDIRCSILLGYCGFFFEDIVGHSLEICCLILFIFGDRVAHSLEIRWLILWRYCGSFSENIVAHSLEILWFIL